MNNHQLFLNLPCDYALSKSEAIKKTRSHWTQSQLKDARDAGYEGIAYQGDHGGELYLQFDDVIRK